MVRLLMGCFVILAPILILVFAIIPIRRKDADTAIVWEITGRCVAVFLLAVFLLFVLPGFTRVFEDFGTDLPAATELLCRVGSSWLSALISLGVGMAVLIGEAILFTVLRKQPSTTGAAIAISILTSGGTLLSVVVAFAALILPLVKLLNDLS